MRNVLGDYQICVDKGIKPEASAMLVLASRVEALRLLTNDELGHQICMGIRHAIFGSGDQQHIGTMGDIADAIRESSQE